MYVDTETKEKYFEQEQVASILESTTMVSATAVNLPLAMKLSEDRSVVIAENVPYSVACSATQHDGKCDGSHAAEQSSISNTDEQPSSSEEIDLAKKGARRSRRGINKTAYAIPIRYHAGQCVDVFPVDTPTAAAVENAAQKSLIADVDVEVTFAVVMKIAEEAAVLPDSDCAETKDRIQGRIQDFSNEEAGTICCPAGLPFALFASFSGTSNPSRAEGPEQVRLLSGPAPRTERKKGECSMRITDARGNCVFDPLIRNRLVSIFLTLPIAKTRATGQNEMNKQSH